MQKSKQMARGAKALGSESIPKLVLRFSVPAIISMLVNAIYNIVDQIFIGWDIGQLGIGATNVSMPLTTICTAAALLIGVGGAANFNLRLGSGDRDSAGVIIGNAVSMLAIFGVLIGVVSLAFLEPLLRFFGATETIMPYALDYTFIVALGLPMMVFTTGAAHIIRADGSPTYAMIMMISGAVFNLIFDPIFLFVCHMGIKGIALATTLSQVLTATLGAVYLLKKFKSVEMKKEHFRPRFSVVKTIASLGAASCFNQLAMTVVQIAMNNTLRHYGALSIYGADVALAAVGAISKINIVFMAFVIGFSQGSQPIVSFNYGAKNYARVKQAYKIAVTAATICAILAFLVFQIFPEQVILIFGENDPLYLQFAVRYLRIYMLLTFVNGMQPVTSNFFTSIGKAQLGIWMSLTRQVLCLLPLIAVLPLFLGIDGVMYAGPIADGIAAALSIVFVVREMRKMNAEQRRMEAAGERPLTEQTP